MIRYILLSALLTLQIVNSLAASRTFTITGRVINENTREPIPYVAVTIDGQPQVGGTSNPDGEFSIAGVEPGKLRHVGQSLGYEVANSSEFQVSATTQPVEIYLTPSSRAIDTIVVRPSLFRRLVESPASMKFIGVQQIEKSPGANRDVSRIVQNYPGVSFSPAGYRNDLIVRGGSPSENRFYVDGIEIPNINHFSTEGASGGPVSILNADLIQEIEFYSGAFPVQRSGALSSIIDVKLRDGDPDSQSFKATLGASEVSLSGSGHLSDKSTYIFSIRQSYLQLLFKALGLPFLPNFIDGQVKIKQQLSARDELSFLYLMGIDDMTLNEEGTTETSEYILGYLPRIEQQTFTTGLRYRHFEDGNSLSLVASHSYVSNRYTKYQDNDESDPSNLNLRLKSRDQKSTLRGAGEFAYVPFDPESHGYKVVLVDSCVKHELVGSPYNRRRESCERTVKAIQKLHPEVEFLRDAKMEWLEEVIGEITQEDYIRAEYAITEVTRLLDACDALEKGDYETVGRKMYGTHTGMSVLYEVSCVELDFLNEVAKRCGVSGSRVMGGGFGGCTINVVKSERYDDFVATARDEYKSKFGIDCKIYPVVISDGARKL